MVSMRLSTRRAVTTPASVENTRMPATASTKAWKMRAVKPRRSTTSRPTTRRSPSSSSSERTTA